MMILHSMQDMVICFTKINEVMEASERHPLIEGFHFFIILYVHNFLENMLKNFLGNGDFLPLDPWEDLGLVWTRGVSGMLVGMVMVREERAYVFI